MRLPSNLPVMGFLPSVPVGMSTLRLRTHAHGRYPRHVLPVTDGSTSTPATVTATGAVAAARGGTPTTSPSTTGGCTTGGCTTGGCTPGAAGVGTRGGALLASVSGAPLRIR
jgi:hypothetical protein